MSNISEFLYINNDLKLRFINNIIDHINNETIPTECKLENDNVIYYVKICGKFKREHKSFMIEAVKQHFINNFVLIRATYYIYDLTIFIISVSIFRKNHDFTIINSSLNNLSLD